MDLVAYVLFQISGAIFGCFAANIIFELPIVTISTNVRHDLSQFLSEILATFGLVVVIFLAREVARLNIPVLVGSYIASAYWFTSSTSFANPAVTIARQFSDTFTGISPLVFLRLCWLRYLEQFWDILLFNGFPVTCN